MARIIKLTRPIPPFGMDVYERIFWKNWRVLSAETAGHGAPLEIFIAVDEEYSHVVPAHYVTLMLANEGTVIWPDNYLCFPVIGMPGTFLIQYTGS